MALATRLRTYPYTYLRTILMKKKLLDRADYDKILKMSPDEIAKFIEEFEYKEEVDSLAMDYQGVELVERALQKNLGKNFGKLLRISSPDLKKLIIVYQRRYDVYNVKTILRAKFSGLSADEARLHLNPVSVEPKALFEKLLTQNSVEEIASATPFLSEADIRAGLDYFKSNNSLVALENALDKYYFKYVISQLPYLIHQGKLYKNFLMQEIDVINLKLLLRLKSEKAPDQTVKDLIFAYGMLKKDFIDRLLKSDVQSILKELESTYFKDVVTDITKEKLNFTDIELKLVAFLQKKANKLIRQSPLSVDTIIGYMFLKDIEVKNLSRITKAKQLGLSEEFIEKTIVI